MISSIANFPEAMNYILGALLCILITALAYAYLKPHLLHRTRPLSTLALKGSYIIYLIVTLVIIYLSVLSDGGINSVFQGAEFFILLLIVFVPTLAILSRKLDVFSQKRVGFNIVFTVVNLLMAVLILILYFV